MKRSRFKEEQIIGILREQEAGVALRRSAGVTASARRPSTSGRPGSAEGTRPQDLAVTYSVRTAATD